MKNFGKQYLYISKEQAKEIISEVGKIADEYGISHKRLAGIISDSKNYTDIIVDEVSNKEKVSLENNYEEWGNPSEENKKWIDDIKLNNTDLFNQLEGKIIFDGKFIIVDGMKFDNKPLDFKGSYNASMEEAEKIKGRRLPTKEEFEKLFDLFTINSNYYREQLIEMLSVSYDSFWSSTVYATSTDYAWYGSFSIGYTNNTSESSTLRTLCIHD